MSSSPIGLTPLLKYLASVFMEDLGQSPEKNPQVEMSASMSFTPLRQCVTYVFLEDQEQVPEKLPDVETSAPITVNTLQGCVTRERVNLFSDPLFFEIYHLLPDSMTELLMSDSNVKHISSKEVEKDSVHHILTFGTILRVMSDGDRVALKSISESSPQAQNLHSCWWQTNNHGLLMASVQDVIFANRKHFRVSVCRSSGKKTRHFQVQILKDPYWRNMRLGYNDAFLGTAIELNKNYNSNPGEESNVGADGLNVLTLRSGTSKSEQVLGARTKHIVLKRLHSSKKKSCNTGPAKTNAISSSGRGSKGYLCPGQNQIPRRADHMGIRSAAGPEKEKSTESKQICMARPVSGDVQSNNVVGPQSGDVQSNNVVGPQSDDVQSNNVVGPQSDYVQSNNVVGPQSDDVQSNNVVGPQSDDVQSNNVVGPQSDDVQSNNVVGPQSDDVPSNKSKPVTTSDSTVCEPAVLRQMLKSLAVYKVSTEVPPSLKEKLFQAVFDPFLDGGNNIKSSLLASVIHNPSSSDPENGMTRGLAETPPVAGGINADVHGEGVKSFKDTQQPGTTDNIPMPNLPFHEESRSPSFVSLGPSGAAILGRQCHREICPSTSKKDTESVQNVPNYFMGEDISQSPLPSRQVFKLLFGPSFTIPSQYFYIKPPVLPSRAVAYRLREDGVTDKVLGRGCFGKVIEGILHVRAALKRKVVIKEHFRSRNTSIIREASINMYLESTGCVPVCYGLLRDLNGRLSIVMELIGSGKTLQHLLCKKIVSRVHWLNIACQLASGLAKIHDKEILINDIKPDNILVTLSDSVPQVKYCDMGSATYMYGVVHKGINLDMYAHMGPEVRAHLPTSKANDIYGLGRVVKKMYQTSHISGLLPLSSRCMMDDPADRPTASELHEMLSESHRLGLMCPVVTSTSNKHKRRSSDKDSSLEFQSINNNDVIDVVYRNNRPGVGPRSRSPVENTEELTNVSAMTETVSMSAEHNLPNRKHLDRPLVAKGITGVSTAKMSALSVTDIRHCPRKCIPSASRRKQCVSNISSLKEFPKPVNSTRFPRDEKADLSDHDAALLRERCPIPPRSVKTRDHGQFSEEYLTISRSADLFSDCTAVGRDTPNSGISSSDEVFCEIHVGQYGGKFRSPPDNYFVQSLLFVPVVLFLGLIAFM